MGLEVTLNGYDVSPSFSGRLISSYDEIKLAWHLPEEAPVNLLYNGNSFAVMMATPQDIEDFAVGFSVTEGIADGLTDIDDIRIAQVANGYLVNIKIAAAKLARAEGRRRTLTGRSGCGLCGAQSLDAVMMPMRSVKPTTPEAVAVLSALRGFKAKQPMNTINKSTHAAGFCDLDGTIKLVREDIGRHNALDKLAGALARQGLSAATGFLLLSSRFSVEMAQKSVAIGAGFVASISAPSALALMLAQRSGLQVATLAGDSLMIFDKVNK